MKSLLQQLTELDSSPNPHRRGRLFESFVAQILEEEGYSVSINPKAAPPRQTDLFAIREEQSFLIEAKWLRKPTHVGQLSSVR
jgi:Holliday junction resolvase